MGADELQAIVVAAPGLRDDGTATPGMAGGHRLAGFQRLRCDGHYLRGLGWRKEWIARGSAPSPCPLPQGEGEDVLLLNF